ncbi:hypothetical protein CIHG_07587 [Coccidioides immitis H538.4]|uniref:Uncharacterized protein n=3 Tax=Coccidioides immitis TaxID=5501 RepID=A0A0J8R2Y0_COCIT|nr:hypothetical protein CIRG_07879 [Coccidioides immitis RMSCC 2394]KMU79524.1 hypothetical protein CISG_01942 [Coccidioides immitis RMSCC 3703]KMU89904.1 hypothetical protein CIHG_07587 [Coccidioides immitis H538.4]
MSQTASFFLAGNASKPQVLSLETPFQRRVSSPPPLAGVGKERVGSGDCGSGLVLSLSQPADKEAERGEKPQVPAGDLIARGVFDTGSPSKRPRALRLSTVKTGETAWLDSVNTARAQEIAAGRGYSWK